MTGFGAIGLTIGPMIGFRVAGLIGGGADDALLAPFSPGTQEDGRATEP